jgi:hypothetical protein
VRGAAKQFAEKLASGAKALGGKKGFIATLKALRHPKSSFSSNRKAVDLAALTARLEAAPFQNEATHQVFPLRERRLLL